MAALLVTGAFRDQKVMRQRMEQARAVKKKNSSSLETKNKEISSQLAVP